VTKSDVQAERLTLDVACFEALAEFDEAHKADVLAEMGRLFTEEARRWLVEAERAVAGGDIVILRRVGHSLKSACGAIGAERMRDLAIRLERAAISVSLDEAEAIVKALADEGAAVIERLRHHLTRGQTSCS
jgi:HPt (histidine-containing phosphotransfer) domain-containing protein